MNTPASDIVDLYGHHRDWLRNWLRRQLGNAADAADLAHDTFVKVIVSRRSASSFGPEPRALLTHIAKGLLIDLWRRRDVERAYVEALARLPADHVPCAETQALVLEALVQIEALLYGLPTRTREVFLLSQLDGLRYAQIASQLDVSVVTVKRHMRAAFAACLALP
ncbi:MAG: sigma-70 family RNA polymerase sigma factor [Steroidobacteraceae bacterium]